MSSGKLAQHRKEPAMTGAVSTTYILSFVAEDNEIVYETLR